MNALDLLKKTGLKEAAKKAEKYLPGKVRTLIRKKITPSSVPSPTPGPTAIALNGNSLNCILLHLETPTELPNTDEFSVKGWFASPEEVLSVSSEKCALKLTSRVDIKQQYQNLTFVNGFEGNITKAALFENSILLSFELESRNIKQYFPRKLNKAQKKQIKTLRHKKLASIIQCPIHKTGMPTDFNLPTKSKVTCSGSKMGYDPDLACFDFLPQEFKDEFKIEKTENVSAHNYDPLANSLISDYSAGLVLDCGAGFRSFNYPNVINFEIAAYPSTDVLGVNEKLPFQNESFDCVFTFAVLEHVKDPWGSAKEISRVLKKEGTLFAVVPFLQPRHGYPNHYYNMTNEGLINLFDGEIEIKRKDVLPSGLPIWSLNWILMQWADGLKGDVRENFLDLKIKDLLASPISYLNKDFVKELSLEKNLELASTTLIMGKKR